MGKRISGVKKKKGGGSSFFLQVILFIPEQLENTSLNVNPESFQSLIHQRSEMGVGFRVAHTQHSTAYP